jgi:hypothetical protein
MCRNLSHKAFLLVCLRLVVTLITLRLLPRDGRLDANVDAFIHHVRARSDHWQQSHKQWTHQRSHSDASGLAQLGHWIFLCIRFLLFRRLGHERSIQRSTALSIALVSGYTTVPCLQGGMLNDVCRKRRAALSVVLVMM